MYPGVTQPVLLPDIFYQRLYSHRAINGSILFGGEPAQHPFQHILQLLHGLSDIMQVSLNIGRPVVRYVTAQQIQPMPGIL